MIRRLGCFGLLIALALVAVMVAVTRSWSGPGPATKAITVSIAPKSTLAAAATTLEQAGAIRSAQRFRLLARLLGGRASIKAGDYRIAPRESQSAILSELQSGHTLERFVTIPEGLPSVMVADVLARAPLAGPDPVPPEGSVLPDTYEIGPHETRAALVKRMQAAMTRYLTQAWAKRAPNLVVTTPAQALILASIVEKETAKPTERATVAAVYANRLRAGMKLQADPTIIYPITQGRPLGHPILRSEIEARNAYNTYASTGLPAGPIANPGRASIDAVLHPAASQALYFVADGTGGHVFATTLAEHNVNVRKWQAIRKERGL